MPLPLQDLSSGAIEIVPPAETLGGDSLLWIGAASLAGAVVVIAFMVLTRRPSRLVASPLGAATVGTGPSTLEALLDVALRQLERVVRTNARHNAARRLDRAGLRIEIGELVMINLGAILILGGVGTLWRGFFGATVGVLLAVALPRLYVDRRASKRQAMFEDALPDVLSSIANVLRVGYSLNVGLGAVAKEYEDPVSTELNRALNEARVSGSLTNALRNVAERMESVDLRWVIDAIEINSTVGGDLVEVLENVAGTIRARARLNAQVSALTAEARMSAIVLFLLPPGLGAFIALSNPEYFDGIWGTALTYWMFGLVATMLASGGFWIRRMINAAVL